MPHLSMFHRICDAAIDGDADLVASLLAQGADPLACDAYGGLTPIMHAAFHGQLSCVRALLPFSDLSAVGKTGLTALMLAACQRHPDCALALLPSSHPDAVDLYGCTALMHACTDAQSDACARALLSTSNLFAMDPDGDTALDMAIQSGSICCVDLLLPFYAHDPMSLTRAGAHARGSGHPDIAERIASCSLALSENSILAVHCHKPQTGGTAARPSRI